MKNSSLHNFGLLLLRVSFATMMLTHGIPKLLRLVAGNYGFSDPLGMGGPLSLILATLIEVVFPLLIIIGYKTRLAVIPLIFIMLVAAFIVHSADPFGTKELSLLYLFGFSSVALLGAGKYSLDKK